MSTETERDDRRSVDLHRLEVELARLSGGVETITAQLTGRIDRAVDRVAGVEAVAQSIRAEKDDDYAKLEAADADLERRLDVLAAAQERAIGSRRAWAAVGGIAGVTVTAGIGAAALFL